ncbi:helix-turn-helix transcriptional regulator [Pseudoflavitalea sp. G-6-1-2]|uniref:helix-turn-helix domain-containing protein n=1 Tax=Pseudoflavitalea sp. G-6-1-2 TaxID=2728841 RepID=UPI00146A4752|nr:helix-turn-helix transcriptional regulator [Pseudoflavitalea sp. G-6-1-2]NML19537.1 helix-turn-helix transcriptional regulator [Pseudoflavitalea sp. G-6-1-2]
MNKPETIEQFYRNKLNWVPDSLRKGVGHFNVFRLEPYTGHGAQPVPYSRKDYFKIGFGRGAAQIAYADKVLEIKKQGIFFGNPMVPYRCDLTDEKQTGYFCVFTAEFFHHFGSLNQYEVFKPKGTPVFELNDEQCDVVCGIYERMLQELNSDYAHKYDLLRNLTWELLHYVMKSAPATSVEKHEKNANERMSELFLELLERQFPIEDARQRVVLRSASDFSNQLGVHVNHLNRALKEITQKTTSEIIAERLLQESKVLLKHSSWNVSEIAYSLGFTEPTHFNNFFKKHMDLSPTKFRNV